MYMGSYMILSGALSVGAALFFRFYEGEYGVEYYLEEYESGFFSNFEGMLQVCMIVGILLIVIGAVMAYIGKKTEAPQLKTLEKGRMEHLDKMIEEFHGAVPKEGRMR